MDKGKVPRGKYIGQRVDPRTGKPIEVAEAEQGSSVRDGRCCSRSPSGSANISCTPHRGTIPLSPDRDGQHIPRSALRALPPPLQLGDRGPRLMVGDQLLDRPPVLVAAAVAVGADGRRLPMVLEEGERHLPGFAGLLISDMAG